MPQSFDAFVHQMKMTGTLLLLARQERLKRRGKMRAKLDEQLKLHFYSTKDNISIHQLIYVNLQRFYANKKTRLSD